MTRNYEKLHGTVERLLCNTKVVPLQPMLQVLEEIKCETSMEPLRESIELEWFQHRLTIQKFEHAVTKNYTVEIQLNK